MTPMNAPRDWPDALSAAFHRGERAVLVTVAEARGSTPRETGAAMVVTSGALAGSIGGGHLEFEALRLAREALDAADTGSAAWVVRFPLAARLGQCCGGVATLAFQVVAARDSPWLVTARACLRTNAPFALVGKLGGAADAAARLVVTADDTRGTLGDGTLDSIAIATARERLAAKPGDARADGGLIADHGATLLIHVVRPSGFDVFVFGNGHVGRALVHMLGALPARVRWIDARDDDFPATVASNVEVIVTDIAHPELRSAPAGSYVVILTHSHALDFELALAALERSDWRYLGMIGSATKRAQLARKVADRGLPAEALDRVTCPIGAANGTIRSKEPGAIAVATVAEILAIRERGAAGAMRDIAVGAR